MTDAMNLGMTERLKPLHEKVATMIQEDVLPVDEEFLAEVNVGDRWEYTPRQTEILEGLRGARGANCELKNSLLVSQFWF